MGSYSNATATPTEVGFYYGSSASMLNEKVTATTNSSFTKAIGGLDPNTTYYYKAYVRVNGTGDYIAESKEILGTVNNFTTDNRVYLAYEGCLEMPAMSGVTSSTFTETFGGTKGHKHTVRGNSNQTIVNHTISVDGEVRRNYSMLYDKSKYGALWVSYVMHNGYHADNNAGRNEKWTNDPAISNSDQQTGASYGSLGYSRGHQIASNDRQNTVDCNKQTFYHTNILPQWQNSFNGGVWSTLENDTQGWAPAAGVRDSIYIVTGPVYRDNSRGNISAGGRTIPIPSHFYKAVIKCKFNGSTVSSAQGICFYFENIEHKGADYKDAKYVKSIDWIEEQTGFDFFANLPTGVESSAESNTNFTSFSDF